MNKISVCLKRFEDTIFSQNTEQLFIERLELSYKLQ